MAPREVFRQNGSWIESSDGFRVRSRGRAGMEYVRGPIRIDVDAEALATPGFVLYASAIPEELREQVLDNITRASKWAGFSVEILGT